ncbi:MAG TPA: hypothetical protein ENJ45_00185 [Phaeodactylibacter sp.]|nr:hypothetical protein [Phaeodactylibacter sp.]
MKEKNTITNKKSGTEWAFLNMPLSVLLGFLGVIYIANSHHAQKKIRKIEKLEREVKLLKSEYVEIQTKIMEQSTPMKMLKNNEQNKLGYEKGEIVKID